MADTDELMQLAKDLGTVPGKAIANITKAVEVTARNVKDSAAATLSGVAGKRLTGVPRSVDYEFLSGITGIAGGIGSFQVAAEIGPNLGRNQGAFAGWFEEGAVDGVPGVQPMAKALKDNQSDFEEGLSIAIADALREAIR